MNVHLGSIVKARIHSDCVVPPPVDVSVDDKPVLKDGNFMVNFSRKEVIIGRGLSIENRNAGGVQ